MIASKLAAALVAAQAELPELRKDAKAQVEAKSGAKFSYGYLSLHTLLSEALPVLNRHGIAVMQRPTVGDHGHGLETVLLHESGESSYSEMHVPCALDAGAQVYGSALSYARRYALLSVLGLAPDEESDDDGAAASQKPKKRRAAPKKDDRPQVAVIDGIIEKLETHTPHDRVPGRPQSWKEEIQQFMNHTWGVTSRANLTSAQLDELVDYAEQLLKDEAVPL